MLEHLTSAVFAAHLHDKFLIHYAPERALETVLVEVEDRTRSPRQERFVIVLRGPREPIIPQGMYPIEHATLGTLDLFLSPEGIDEDGTYYALVFNRIHRS